MEENKDLQPEEGQETNEQPTPEQEPQWERNRLDLSVIRDAVTDLKAEIQKVIVGQDETIELLLAALFTGGHVLIEGVPGVAKTLTAKLLSQTLSVQFSRIQFTPDLMPSDVVGTNIFNMKTSEFVFNSGPVFSNIVLIDEINRAPAKTQAALFEVMEEQQVTIDGKTHKMEFPFFVMATQNPIEQEGTYKLPEAQLDRFLFKVHVNYPDLADEKAILHRFKNDLYQKSKEDVKPVFNKEDIHTCREVIEKIHIDDTLVDYIAEIIHNTRNNGDLYLGASTRASLSILRTAKAMAAIAGRDFVTPDDIKYVLFPILNHRVILTPERELEGYTAADVIKDIIQKVEIPR